MALTEEGKFISQVKKLQGLCEEHNLVYTYTRDQYPLMLTVKTTGDVSGQMSMLEDAEEEGFRSPDARLTYVYKNGDIDIHSEGKFTISKSLRDKIEAIFTRMNNFWLSFFFRDLLERGAIMKKDLPTIEDEQKSNAAAKRFDEDGEPIESFDDEVGVDDVDEDDSSGSDDDAGEEDDYEYDEPTSDNPAVEA